MPNNYLISIITPTYNSETYLEKTILSILNQTYKNFEHIIIDGGSKDNTLAIIAKYPHIKLITGKDNGMYDAINKGIKTASGNIIGCLNSDDLYYPNTLEIVNNYFGTHPDTIIINGDCSFIDDKEKELYTFYSPEYTWKDYAIMDYSTITFPTVFWKKELNTKVGYFDDHYKMAADFDFYARIGQHYNIRNTHKLLAKFRLHAESLTSTKQALSQKEMNEIHAKFGITDNYASQCRKFYALLVLYFTNLRSYIPYKIKHKFSK